MKRYHEYLELYSYFARQNEPRLSRPEFDQLDAEFVDLAGRLTELDAQGRARLGELKALLLRDKP